MLSGSGELGSYSSLKDVHLAHYFSRPDVLRHLVSMGLVTRTGAVVSEREWQRHQLDLERRRREQEQLEHRKKLEDAEKSHRNRVLMRMRRQERQLSTSQPELFHFDIEWNYRPTSGIHGHVPPHSTSPSTHTSSTPALPAPPPPPPPPPKSGPVCCCGCHCACAYHCASVPRVGYNHFNPPRTRESQSSGGGGGGGGATPDWAKPRKFLQRPRWSRRKGLIGEPYVTSLALDQSLDVLLHRPSPSSTNHRVSTRLQRSSTPRVLVDDLNQSKLTLQYVGGGANINHAPVRLTMVQQPSGAYNVTVYDGRVSPGDKINIVSRRRINFPFSMTVYEDAVATCRLSACCEFRYAEGRRLGGPSGHLRVVTITGGGPCFRCKVRELEARRHRNRSGRGSHRTKSPSPSSSSSQSSPSSPSSSKKRKKKGKAVKEGSSEESGDESDDVSDIENVDSLESSEEEEGRDHDSETNDDSHFDSESFDDDDDDDEKSKSSDPYTRSSENGSESSSDITKSISRYKSKRPASGFGNRRRNPLDNEGNLRKNSGKKKSPKKDQDKGNSSDEVAAILLHNLAEGNLFESDSVDSGKDFDSGREESSSAFNRPSDEEVASILGVDARTGQLKGFFATQMSSSDLDSEKCFQRLVISSESETERFFDDIVREDRALSTDDHSQDSETLSENIEEDDQGNSYSSERSKSEGTEVEEEEETSEVTSVVSTESRTSSAPEEVEEDIS
ncbi:uncharacterized protein LOC143031723 isoform X1 [Oratosquilla oratoria]|uniref:uncharacterized protein LOC143031723 isoform X1 n=1 Tax=Oratosquilla oratoria TaxID=337810 RepID=UPI003F76AEA2